MVGTASSEEITFQMLVQTFFMEMRQDAWQSHMIKLHG